MIIWVFGGARWLPDNSLTIIKSKITSMLQKLWFTLTNYKHPVWDTDTSPPELLSFIENHTPGKALDLGCGTGTNAITLAKSGWQVTGVDYVTKAIRLAKQKAHSWGAKVEFFQDDVTNLKSI